MTSGRKTVSIWCLRDGLETFPTPKVATTPGLSEIVENVEKSNSENQGTSVSSEWPTSTHSVNMVDEHKEDYTKLKKAQFHVTELEEIILTGEKEDFWMASERFCHIYKALDTATTWVKDAMLDSDKSQN